MGQNFAAWSRSSCMTSSTIEYFSDRTSSRSSLTYSLRFCSLDAFADAAAGAGALTGAFWDCALSWAKTAEEDTRNAKVASAALFFLVILVLTIHALTIDPKTNHSTPASPDRVNAKQIACCVSLNSL